MRLKHIKRITNEHRNNGNPYSHHLLGGYGGGKKKGEIIMKNRKEEREIAFMDWWLAEHKGEHPTFADAIAWAEKKMIDKVGWWMLKQPNDGNISVNNCKKFLDDFRKNERMNMIYQNKIIDCEVYRHDVMVHLGKLDNITDCLAPFTDEEEIQEVYESLKQCSRGKTIQLEGGQVVVYMPKIPTTPFDFATLQHELFHAVCYITNRVGITPSADSEEVYAYLLDYLTERVINTFSLTIRPT